MVKHLKGLDTLRAVAALSVVWGHLEIQKNNNEIENLIDLGFHIPSGHIAVIFFFVISGFLITYLLVKEQDRNQTISLKNFYMRRILRIWPLYYLVLILSFTLFRVHYSWESIIYCFTIFPNVGHAFYAGWPTSPQIWSIGVEEQFYLFWPILFKIIPKRKIPFVLILFFISYSILPHVIGFINARTFKNDEMGTIINRFFYGTKFNCMAIGALFGYLFATGSKTLTYFNKDLIAFLSIVGVFGFWFTGFELTHFTDEMYSILFAIALYNIVVSTKINIDIGISRFIGKISYGIYMYHWIIILLAFKYIPVFENKFLYNIIIYSAVFGCTIITSWISFNTVEKYFLNIKKKY